MKKGLLVVIGVIAISLGVFATNQEIDFGVFAESSMTNFANGQYTNNANPIGEYLGYKYIVDKKSYVQAQMSYSGYTSNVNYMYYDINKNDKYSTNGDVGNNRLQLSLLYGYDVHQELLMPVPTYIEVGIGYGNWTFNSPNDIYQYPSQINFNWFYIPVGLAIVNKVHNTTYTLRGGALAEIGGQANYNSFNLLPKPASIPSNSLALGTSIGYYLSLETAYQLNTQWVLKWNLYYMNTPLKVAGTIPGLEQYSVGYFNNQSAGVMCALGYQF